MPDILRQDLWQLPLHHLPGFAWAQKSKTRCQKKHLKHISREAEVSLQCTAVFLEDKRHSLFARYFAVKTATAVTGLLLKRLASFAGCLGAGQGWQRKLKLLMTGFHFQPVGCLRLNLLNYGSGMLSLAFLHYFVCNLAGWTRSTNKASTTLVAWFSLRVESVSPSHVISIHWNICSTFV